MTAASPLETAREEIDARTAQLLVAHDIDAIIVTSGISFRHLAGLYLPHLKVVPEERVFLVWAAPDRVATLVPEWNAEYAQSRGSRGVAIWEWDDSPWAALAARVADLGLARSRIGVEFEHLSVADIAHLQEALPEASFVGIDAALIANRRIKTAPELDHIRAVTRAGENAMIEAISRGRVGMTDRQFAQSLREAAIRQGVDEVSWLALRWGTPDQRTHMLDRPIEPGEVLSIEFGLSIDGYYSDLQRTVIAPPSRDDVAETYARLATVHTQTVARMTPGRPISEFHDEFLATMGGAGLEMWDWWLGHSIGLDVHEGGQIWLRSQEQSTLDVGMVFAVEPTVVEPAVISIEDEVEITAAGPRNLSWSADWSSLPVLGTDIG